jgi:AcrR family transcriptional regulator
MPFSNKGSPDSAVPFTTTGERTARYDKKLRRILAAAAQEFAEQGYDRASIRGVARRAGVSIAGLYYYVRSKEELLFLIQYDVFHGLVERYRAESRGLGHPASRLELLIRNHLERFLANMSELIVCSREIDRLKGDFQARIEAKRREYFTLALRNFAELNELHQGSLVDPRTAALAMFGSINWVYTWYRPASGPSAARMAEDFTRLYLRGVLPPDAEGDPGPRTEQAPVTKTTPTRRKGESDV